MPCPVWEGDGLSACRHGARPRRWVVERATSWFNRCRKLLIRWEKKPQNYLALVHFAAAIVVWRALVG
jgi:putative transposase